MAHLTPLRSSASTVAIALLGATGVTSLVSFPAGAQGVAQTLPQQEQQFTPSRDIGTPGRREPAGTRFSPPRDIGTPGRREPAGTRGSSCSRLLLPTFRTQEAPTSYGYGKTISDRPKLYLYLDSGAQEINLRVSLFEEGSDKAIAVVLERYQGDGGIYEIDLFDAADGGPVSLQVGQTYTLRAEVACADPITQDWSYKVETGVIQRVGLDSALSQQLAGLSTPLERVNFHAQEGFWIDFMNQVAAAAREGRDRPQLITAWNRILKKLESDFAVSSNAGEPNITELFFRSLLERDLVIIEPESEPQS
ncbi:MAG: DUF928 domain-containing protein [Cyanophyceae cyanobacterium]